MGQTKNWGRTMNKYQKIVIMVGLLLCSAIIAYPPVIEYTEGSGNDQIRRLLLSPRTYKKELIHYKFSNGKNFDAVVRKTDRDFMNQLNEMERKGEIVRQSEPKELDAYIRYDFTKMLLEIILVLLPSLGFYILFAKASKEKKILFKEKD